MIGLTAWLILANAGQLLLSFAQAVLLSRWLGVARWGALGRILAVVTIADAVAQTGIERLLTREAAAHPKSDGALLGAALKARLAFAVPVGAVLWGWRGFWTGLLLAANIGQYGVAILNAKMLKAPQAAARLLAGLSAVTAVLLCMLLGRPDVTLALAALSLAGLAKTLGQLAMARRSLVRPADLFGHRTKESLALSWRLLADSWPLWLNGLVMAGVARLDVILIGWLFPAEIADRGIGYYQVAYRLIEGGNVVLGSLALAAFPFFSVLHGASPASLRRSFYRASRYALLLGGSASLIALMGGKTAILVLFGEEFRPATAALMLLAPVLTLSLLNSLLAMLLVATHRTGRVLAISLGLLAVNGTLNLLVLPAFGFAGAAAVKSLTELAGLGFFLFGARDALLPGRSAGSRRPDAV